MENIGHVVRMSVSGYRGQRFEPRQHQFVVSLCMTLYPHCFYQLSCEMSVSWEHPRDVYSMLLAFRGNLRLNITLS